MTCFVAEQFERAAGNCRSMRSMTAKAMASGGNAAIGGDVANYYGLASGGAQAASDPFGLTSAGNAARQYRAAMRDHQFAAIRPLAVKVAEQSIRVGVKKSATRGRGIGRGIVTKGASFLEAVRTAPEFILKELNSDAVDVIESHPLIDLFESPNPYLTKWALLYLTAYSMEAVGEAVWWCDFDGESKSIWYWPRHWIKPVTVNGVAFAKWKVTLPGLPDDFPLIDGADIINFRYPDPSNPTQSHSPTQSLSRPINTLDHTMDAQLASMKNAIRPTLGVVIGDVLPAPGGGTMRPELTPEQRKQIIEALRLAYRGAMHSGDPIILDGLISDLKQVFPNPAELDYLNSSGSVRDQISEGYGTNPIVMGRIEGANRASSAVAHDGFYSLKVNPLLTLISEEMTRKIGPRFSLDGTKLSVWLTQARSRDEDLALRQISLLAGQGWVRPSLVLRQFGLPPDDKVDGWWEKTQEAKANPPPPPGVPGAGTPPAGRTKKAKSVRKRVTE